MKLKTNCPECQASLSVKPELVGRTVRCPACKQPFTIESVRTATSDKSLDNAMAAWSGDSSSEQESIARSSEATLPKSVSRFEIREKLGEGGFGSVYRAWDPVLDRETALKVPHGIRGSANPYARILHEAKAAARLRHPGIVAVFEVGTAVDQPFIAAEFVQGKTLSAILKERDLAAASDQRRLIEWLISVARALAYAHREGIIHRDVKPHNVLIDETGRALLADFGLAMGTAVDSDDRPNAIVGTLAYMSPEQASGDQSLVGPGSDQYALGVILFEILTGKRPFEGNALGLIYQIINDPTPTPSSVSGDVNRDLECICLKALSKQSSNRYESCDTFADDLQRWLDGELVEATNPTWIRRVIHWGRKRPHLAAWSIAGAAIILLATGTTITYAVQQQLENSRLMAAAEAAGLEINAAGQEATEARAALTIAEQKRMAAQAHSDATEYSKTLNSIRTAIRENRIEDAHKLLDRIPWNRRHIEHGLLRREAMGTPFIARHGSSVRRMSWSKDGRILVSVGRNFRQLQFWSGETGDRLARGPIDINDIEACSDAEFSPDSDTLWTCHTRWEDGNTELKSWRIDVEHDHLLIAPIEKKVITAPVSEGNLRLSSIGGLACIFGQDGDGESNLAVFDLVSGQTIAQLDARQLQGHITAAAFRNSSRELICQTRSTDDDPKNTPRYLSVDGGTGEIKPLEFPSKPENEPDGNKPEDPARTTGPEFACGERPDFCPDRAPGLLSSTRKTAAIELSTGVTAYGFEDGHIELPDQIDDVWRGHSVPISCFAMRADGTCVASADYAGEIRIWPLSRQTRFGVTQTELGTKQLGRVSRSHDGLFAACSVPESETGELLIWSTRTGEIVLRLPGHQKGISHVCFHPTAKQLISVDGENVVRLWSAETGETLRQWTPDIATVTDIAFSHDGKEIAIAGETQPKPQPGGQNISATGSLTIWNPETGTQTQELPEFVARVERIVFAPDDQQLYAASADGSIRVWSMTGRQLQETLSCGDLIPFDLTVSETSLVAVCGEPCGTDRPGKSMILAWDRTDHSVLWEVAKQEVADPFHSVDVSDDGSRLVVASNMAASLYETRTGVDLGEVAGIGRTQEGREEVIKTFTKIIPVTEERQGVRRQVISKPDIRPYGILNAESDFNIQTDDIAFTAGTIARFTKVSIRPVDAAVLPAGLSVDTPYFVQPVGENRFRLFTDSNLTQPLDITASGSGQLQLILLDMVALEDATYIYNVTVLKPETVAETAVVRVRKGFGVLLQDAVFLPDSSSILLSNLNQGVVVDSVVPWSVREITNADALITGYALSPDGRVAASYGPLDSNCEQTSAIEFRDTVTGQKIRSLRRRNESIRAAVFHPSNGSLIIASDIGSTAEATTAPEPVNSTTGPSPNAVARTRPAISVIDPETGNTLRVLSDESLSSSITKLAVASDRLLSCSLDGSLHAWNMADGSLVCTLTAPAPAEQIAMSSDGRLAIFQSQHRVYCFLVSSPQQVWSLHVPGDNDVTSAFTDHVQAFDLTNEGKQLICHFDWSAMLSKRPPVLLDPSEVVTSLSQEGIEDKKDLQTLPIPESVLHFKSQDGFLYDPTFVLKDFASIHVVCNHNDPARRSMFVASLHGTEPLTDLVYQDNRLFAMQRDDSRRSTILVWDVETTRGLRDRLRLTTKSPGTVSTADLKIEETATTQYPVIRLTPVTFPSRRTKPEPILRGSSGGIVVPQPNEKINDAPARPAPTPTNSDGNRAAAEWARKFRAQLKLTINGKQMNLSAEDPLPQGGFQVTAILIPESAQGVSDEGLEHIGKLDFLSELSLRTSTSAITDMGARKLCSLPQLRTLNLHATKITDRSLNQLTAIRTLEWLDIGFNQNITDAGMDSLAGMTQLKGINLASTRVTDAGLRKLIALKDLVQIEITTLEISDETVEFFRQNVPQCKLIEGTVAR